MNDAKLFLRNALKAAEETPRLESQARQAAERHELARRIADITRGLQRSWRDADPGKYGTHWFFVRDFALKEGQTDPFSGVHRIAWLDKFWPRDLVDDRAAAERGIEVGSHFQKLDKPIPVPLGDIAEASREVCLGCTKDGFLIGSYLQTEDGPDGDTWEIRLYALCVECPTLRLVARCADEYRISHLLKKP